MVVYEDKDEETIEKIREASFYDEFATTYGKFGMEGLKAYLNDKTRVFTKSCDGDKGLRLIYQNFSPYLYPFSVEYSILVGELIYFNELFLRIANSCLFTIPVLQECN